MANSRWTSALLALTILAAGCSRTDNEPGPGGVTVSEAKALDDAAEMLESPAMAAQPGFYALVGDQFGVHVLAARERHDEEPRLHDLAVMDVGDDGACAKVDLGGLGWRMIKEDGGYRR